MKQIIAFVIFVYLVQPCKNVPVELRKEIDYFNFDIKYRMVYTDSCGKRIYWKDITGVDVMKVWVFSADLAVGSANMFIGI